MKLMTFAYVTSLFVSDVALAYPGMAGLECTVANRYGQSRINYDAATDSVKFVTNNTRNVSMKIFFIQDLADSIVRVRLVVPRAAIQYDLDIQLGETMQTPAGSPARLMLANMGGASSSTTSTPAPTFPNTQNFPGTPGSSTMPGGSVVMPPPTNPATPMFAEGFCKLTRS